MKWSFRIARVSGIDIRVHATFALIIAFFGLRYSAEDGGRGALFGAVLVCCMFLCVTLHELGHSLVAQAFGVTVREIVLLPIGGLARLSKEPQKPLHEFLIAIAGPLVNVVIAAVLLAVALPVFGLRWIADGVFGDPFAHPSWAGLLGWLIQCNVMLAAFNMIPALPMDGGRVFRALLAMLFGKSRATSIASSVGQVLAVGLSGFGLMKHEPVLTAIGVFVFMGATQERAAGQAGQALSVLRAADAVLLNGVVLAPADALGTVIRHLMRSEQSHFAVVHGEQLLGVLAREEALRALTKYGEDAYVAGVMDRNVLEVDWHMPLDEVRSRIIENEGRPVVVRGVQGYLGLLSFEDLSRVARVMSRIDRQRAVGPSRSRSGQPLA